VPGRLEASDGKQGETQAGKALPDRREVRAPARVPGEVDGTGESLHHESAPERAVLVEEPSPRHVARGHGGNGDSRREGDGVPPVEIDDAGDPLVREGGSGCEGGGGGGDRMRRPAQR